MKHRIVVALAAASVVAGCKGSGTPNNSEGMSALTANNSSFRGGAIVPNPGNAPTNTGTGVTGGNGKTTVTPRGYANGNTGKSGGNPANTGPAPSAPGTR